MSLVKPRQLVEMKFPLAKTEEEKAAMVKTLARAARKYEITKGREGIPSFKKFGRIRWYDPDDIQTEKIEVSEERTAFLIR